MLQIKRSNADLFTIRTANIDLFTMNIFSFSYEMCIKHNDAIVHAIHPSYLRN